VLYDGTDLSNGAFQLIFCHAELLAPVPHLVVQIDVNARIVVPPRVLRIVRHVFLLADPQKAEAKGVPKPGAPSRRNGTSLAGVFAMALRKANVLVVDDKRANLLGMEAVLAEEYNVIFANSGEESLDTLKKRGDIDLILMDVQMPDMDGFETAQHIKQMPSAKGIPIIFVTAVYTEDPFIRKGYEVGGIDYFSKPFDPDILKLKVAVYSSFRLKDELLRERELHVRESEELVRVGRKLSALLESLPVGVLIADVDGRICQSTEEVSRILHTSDMGDDDSYGQILGWWNTAGKRLKKDGPLARAVQGESVQSERLEIRRFNGKVKTIVASASPLRGLDGRLVGAVILLQDVTSTREIKESLHQRVTRLISLGIELDEESASAGP
jgi:CheY-like chemotaxis protein